MLRTLFHYCIFLVLLVCLLLTLLAYVSRQQSPIGVIDDQLMDCPDRPVCVSSVQNQDHPAWIEPLSFQDPPRQARKRMQTCVQEIGGTVRKAGDRYLWATFSSKIFGFVDDLELYLEPKAKTFQVRSASRMGYYDFGQNRKRVERLRTCFQGPDNGTGER